MDYLTGEYAASLYGDAEETTLRVSMECLNASNCAKRAGQGEFPLEFPAVPATCQKLTRTVPLTSSSTLLNQAAWNFTGSRADQSVWWTVAERK